MPAEAGSPENRGRAARSAAAIAGGAAAALLVAGCGLGSSSTDTPRAAAPAPTYAVREFAQLPVTPGQPGGLVVDGDTLYVATFGFLVRPADGHDSVYAYDLATGALRSDRTNPIEIARRFPVCTMGMSGMAVDASGRVYLVDMNSRIVRLDPRTGAFEDYATFPLGATGSAPTMPLDMAFGPDGSAYVSDIGGAPVIWRVPPGGGQAEVWFTDTELLGVYSQGGGGLRFDPAGKRLYVGVVTSDQNSARGTVYSIDMADPEAKGAELFHQYSNNVEAPPLGAGPLGIAFGASGKLYVAMPGTNQVSILLPDGREERRIDLPYSPQFVALGPRGTLLVTAWNFPNGPWPVYEIDVGDTPGGLNYPTR